MTAALCALLAWSRNARTLDALAKARAERDQIQERLSKFVEVAVPAIPVDKPDSSQLRDATWVEAVGGVIVLDEDYLIEQGSYAKSANGLSNIAPARVWGLDMVLNE